MGDDLYPESGIKQLQSLEDKNLVIPRRGNRVSGWSGTHRDIYHNIDSFKSAIAGGLTPASVQVVIYNPEPYRDGSTPRDELRDPITAVRTFAAIARENGFFVAYAPSCSLIDLRGAMDNRPALWKACADYLWSKAAPYVDLVDMQTQAIQKNVPEYQAAVTYGAARMRAANPSIKVLSQVSTDVTRSVDGLYNPAYAVHNTVDGYFLAYAWGGAVDKKIIESFLTKAVDTFYATSSRGR
jgi:hypothetical protein